MAKVVLLLEETVGLGQGLWLLAGEPFVGYLQLSTEDFIQRRNSSNQSTK